MKTSNKILVGGLLIILAIITMTLVKMGSYFNDQPLGDGNVIVVRNPENREFDTIDVRGGVDVELQYSSDSSIAIEVAADSNLHQYIQVALLNRTLQLQLKERISYFEKLKITVRTNFLPIIRLSDDAILHYNDTIRRFTDTLVVELDNGAACFIKQMFANHVRCSITNTKSYPRTTEFSVKGFTKSAEFNASSGTLISAENLTAHQAIVTARGNSVVKIKADTVDLDLKDTCKLQYDNDPVIKCLKASPTAFVIHKNRVVHGISTFKELKPTCTY